MGGEVSFWAKSVGEALNVLDFNADPTGTNDATSEIQAAIIEAVAQGIGSVFMPPGVYLIGGPGITQQGGAGFLGGNSDLSNLRLFGVGPETILRFPAADFTSVGSAAFIVLAGSATRNVVLSDFAIDGNLPNITGTISGQTFSGISVNDGTDILIENVVVHDIPGAGPTARARGIALGDPTSTNAKRILARGCIAYDCYGTGLEVVGGEESVGFENCIAFDNVDYQIEVVNATTPPTQDTELFVTNCIADASGGAFGFSITGSGVADPPRRVQIQGTTVIGRLTLDSAEEVFIDDCVVFAAIGQMFDVQNATSAVTVSNSLIAVNPPTVFNMILVSNQGGAGTPTNITFRNNLLISTARHAIVENANGIYFDGNTLLYVGGALNIPLLQFNSIEGIDNAVVRRNIIISPTTLGVPIIFDANTGGNQGDILVADNFIDTNNAHMVQFDLSGSGVYSSTPIVVNNIGISDDNVIQRRCVVASSFANLPEDSVIVGGGGGRGSAAFGVDDAGTRFLVEGSPEGVVTGYVGDMAQRWDGGVGTSVYIKESGNGTKTGWVAK